MCTCVDSLSFKEECFVHYFKIINTSVGQALLEFFIKNNSLHILINDSRRQ